MTTTTLNAWADKLKVTPEIIDAYGINSKKRDLAIWQANQNSATKDEIVAIWADYHARGQAIWNGNREDS